MSTDQAKLLDSASGQVSFRYNMKYIYHCEYLVKEWDTQQYRYIEKLPTITLNETITDTEWIYATYRIFHFSVKSRPRTIRLWDDKKG